MSHFIDYASLIEKSMRMVVKNALSAVVANLGQLGGHYFYISFFTGAHGVVLSERIRKKYPQEMTIVLQYEFEDLEVKEDYFTVKLSFGGVKEKVKVPFYSITSFTDPSLQFALQFADNEQQAQMVNYHNMNINHVEEGVESKDIEDGVVEEGASELPSNVISIDSFVKQRIK